MAGGVLWPAEILGSVETFRFAACGAVGSRCGCRKTLADKEEP